MALRSLEICKKKMEGCRCSRLEAYGNPIENANFLCLFADSFRISLGEFESRNIPDDCERSSEYAKNKEN